MARPFLAADRTTHIHDPAEPITDGNRYASVVLADVFVDHLEDNPVVDHGEAVVEKFLVSAVPFDPLAFMGALAKLRAADKRPDMGGFRHIAIEHHRELQVIDQTVGVQDAECRAVLGQSVQGLVGHGGPGKGNEQNRRREEPPPE